MRTRLFLIGWSSVVVFVFRQAWFCPPFLKVEASSVEICYTVGGIFLLFRKKCRDFAEL